MFQKSSGNSRVALSDRWLSFSIVAMVLLGCLSANGCDSGQAEKKEKPSSQADGATGAAEAETQEPDAREDEQARANNLPGPQYDRWQSERLSQAAEAQLQQLGRALADVEKLSTSSLAKITSPDFVCDPLRPAQLTQVYADRRFSVKREDASADPASDQQKVRRVGPARLSESLREMLTTLEPVTQVRTVFRIVELVEVGKSFRTQVLFELSGQSKQRLIQQNAIWNCRWSMDQTNELPKLRSIEVQNFEQVVFHDSGKKLFEDCTQAALSANASFRHQLSLGLKVTGNQAQDIPLKSADYRCGLAVGDVNGDGLEDLYVCQPEGFPNRLLLQSADGTATDVSVAWGVNWLDASASALLLDLDNDGDQDLAIATNAGVVLMENNSRGQFQRKNVLPLGSGKPQSLLAVDYDRDGRLDLYLAMAGLAGYDDEAEEGSQSTFLFHDAIDSGGNVLLRNEIFGDGPWRFTDVTRSAGLYLNQHRHSLAGAWEDFDNDGDLDLYVANDYGKNSLYRNDGGYFRDLAKLAKTAEYGSGKSVSWADYDRDGHMDLYVGNTFSPSGLRVTRQTRFMEETDDTTRMIYPHFAKGNTLYRNLGNGTFAEVGNTAGVNAAGWAWSSRFVDWNNDGWEDLLVANGFLSGDTKRIANQNDRQPSGQELSGYYWQEVVPRAKAPIGTADADHGLSTDVNLSKMLRRGHSLAGQQRNRVYLNTGTSRFADVSAVSGFDLTDDGRAMALVDWDGDGDVDVWTLNHSAPQIRLLCNTTHSDEHYLEFRLQGRICNRDAIGARVELHVTAEDKTPRIKTLRAGEGFLSQSSKWIHFGLGTDKQVARVVVRWPAGETETFDELKVDGRYVLIQGSAQAQLWKGPKRQVRLEVQPHNGLVRTQSSPAFHGRWVKAEKSESNE